MSDVVKTSSLTNSERLVIGRRRAGESQKAAADRAGVTLGCWRRWEAADHPDSPSRVSIGKLNPHEICFLKRRRAGMLVHELAEELELSRWWITQIEYGRAPVDRLASYWRAREAPWRPKRRLQAVN